MSADTPPFDATTTTDEVLAGVDLTGANVIVTGATSGIGEETARSLAAVGGHVIMAVRDVGAGGDVRSRIIGQHPDASVDVLALDLSDLVSVRRFARDVSARLDDLGLLINNAGVMGTAFGRTADGFETQFGTNHLGHFLLTDLLRPLLDAHSSSRVVNLSSAGHTMSDIIWDDPNYLERPYDKWESYGQSKTANILFSIELDRQMRETGGHAFAVHPGMIATNLSRYLEPGDFKALMRRGAERAAATGEKPAAMPMKSIPAGAATTVWAATAPELADHGGAYLLDCGVGVAASWARDPDSAARLWAMSEQLVG